MSLSSMDLTSPPWVSIPRPARRLPPTTSIALLMPCPCNPRPCGDRSHRGAGLSKEHIKLSHVKAIGDLHTGEHARVRDALRYTEIHVTRTLETGKRYIVAALKGTDDSSMQDFPKGVVPHLPFHVSHLGHELHRHGGGDKTTTRPLAAVRQGPSVFSEGASHTSSASTAAARRSIPPDFYRAT